MYDPTLYSVQRLVLRYVRFFVALADLTIVVLHVLFGSVEIRNEGR
jgi:hypothetical protein